MRKKSLKDDPKIADTLLKVEEKVKGITDPAKLIYSPEIKALMTDLINHSTLSANHKKYLIALFVKKKSSKKAVHEAFGTDLGYDQESNIINTMNRSKSVEDIKKQFIEIIKSIYVKFLPIASLKEFELLLKPGVDDKVKLEAIKDIKATAGLGVEGSKAGQLPYHITLNMPGSNPTQTNIKEGGEM